VLALAGLALAVWFFTAGDDATTGTPVAAVPGEASHATPPFAAEVRRGNVVIALQDRADRAAALRLALDVAGPDSPALRAAGQAVIVDAPPPTPGGTEIQGLGTSLVTCERDGKPARCPPLAVIAYAQGRSVAVASVGDPALRSFVEYWLGRAAG
jgi:hypothetical protein